MGIVFASGFEEFATAAQIRERFLTVNNDAVSIITGKDRGKALRVNQSNDRCIITVPGYATYRMAFNWRQDTGTLATEEIIEVYNDTIRHFYLRCTAAGEIEALDNGSTQIGISSGLGLAGQTWYNIQFAFTINATTGVVIVDVDGTEVINATGADTYNSGAVECNRLWMKGSSNNNDFDDLLVFDDQGSDLTDFPTYANNGIIVETVFPDADGTTNQFTRVGGGSNNYEAVDDGSTPDDDTTYNHSSTVDEDELYSYPDAERAVDSMIAVGGIMRCRKNAAGDRQARVLIRQNAVEAEGTNLGVGPGYRYHAHIFENNPDGGGDWTESTANAAEIGVTIES